MVEDHANWMFAARSTLKNSVSLRAGSLPTPAVGVSTYLLIQVGLFLFSRE